MSKCIYKTFLAFTGYTLGMTHIVQHVMMSVNLLVLFYKLLKKDQNHVPTSETPHAICLLSFSLPQSIERDISL